LKLLLDEMWTPLVAEQLRALGYDVEAVASNSDLRTEPDETILALATLQGRALVTENIHDFRRIGAEAVSGGIGHAGIILTVPGRFPRRGGQGVGRLVRALDLLLTSNPDLTNTEYWLQPPD
jgi:hypothetical protein